MTESLPHVAVLIVTYNSAGDIVECLRSVFASNDDKLHHSVVVVDNASIDNTADVIAQQFPQVHLIRNQTNTGFAGGNNRGWDAINEQIQFEAGPADYLALLNPDTVVESGWLTALVQYLHDHPQVASVQPKIMLHGTQHEAGGRGRFNTAGNRSHYLGFGTVTGYNEPDEGQYDQPRSIDFASGACCVLRADVLRQVGLFDEIFFLYLEDADLSWKLRSIGWDTRYVPTARIWHKYNPGATLKHLYHLEKNRWLLIFSYYRWPTLLLIGPMIDLMELGTFYFAWRQGLLRCKWQVYKDMFRLRKNSELFDALLRKRLEAQHRRTIPDRRFMGRFAGQIQFAPVNRGLLRFLINPLLASWWYAAKFLIRW